MPYWIGQGCGIIATVASIIMPFYKKKWQMLVNTAAVNLLMALNFVLIGEIGSAAALCAVAFLQCLLSLWHTFRDTSPGPAETIVFVLLYLTFGFLGMVSSEQFVWEVNSHNLLELLPIAGSLSSMTFVFIRDEQKARWLLLLTCLIWSAYTGIIGATAFFAQFVSVLTTIAAMIRYRKK